MRLSSKDYLYPVRPVVFFTSLFEGKNLAPVLLKAGWHPVIVEWAVGVDPKFAGFAVNDEFVKIRNDAIKRHEAEGDEAKIQDTIKATKYLLNERVWRIRLLIQTVFKENFKPRLPKNANNITQQEATRMHNQLRIMQDWASHPDVDVKLQNLQWDDALQQATAWHEAIKEQGGNSLELQDGQEIVMTFEDKSYWLSLGTDFCSEEGQAMGHCGRASTGYFYSLRTVSGVPKVSADINVEKKLAGQICCKGNSKPPEKYHRKILELLGKLGVKKIDGGAYGGDTSFDIYDLSEQDAKWFEETYGYKIENDHLPERVEEILDAAVVEGNLRYTYVSTDNGHDHYVVPDIRASVDFPLFLLEQLQESKLDYASSLDAKDALNDAFGSALVVEDFAEVEHLEGLYFHLADGPHYNCSGEGYGLDHADGYRYEDPKDWAESVVSNLKDDEERIDNNLGKAVVAIINFLVDKGFNESAEIAEIKRVIELAEEADNVEVSIVKPSEVKEPKLYLHLESKIHGGKWAFDFDYPPREFANWVNKNKVIAKMLNRWRHESFTKGAKLLEFADAIPEGTLNKIVATSDSKDFTGVSYFCEVDWDSGSITDEIDRIIADMDALPVKLLDMYKAIKERHGEGWFRQAMGSVVDRPREGQVESFVESLT